MGEQSGQILHQIVTKTQCWSLKYLFKWVVSKAKKINFFQAQPQFKVNSIQLRLKWPYFQFQARQTTHILCNPHNRKSSDIELCPNSSIQFSWGGVCLFIRQTSAHPTINQVSSEIKQHYLFFFVNWKLQGFQMKTLVAKLTINST